MQTSNLEQRLQSLSGVDFERVCGRLVSSMGFTIEYTKTSGDGGIDIIAHNSAPLLKGKYIIQCKRYSGKVGEPIIRDLVGVVTKNHANKGILITTGSFSVPAREFAADLPVELIDGSMLIQLLVDQGIEVSPAPCPVSGDPIWELFADYPEKQEAYFDYRQKCIEENYSISSVGALAYFLYSQALEPAYGTDLNIGIPNRMKLLEKTNELLCLLDNSSPAREKNRNSAVKLCVCKLIHAQTNFLLGSYQTAKEIYSHILEWKDLSQSTKTGNGLVDLFWNVTFDMCSFYSCIGEKSIANQWLEHPTISQMRFMKRSILLKCRSAKVNLKMFASEEAFYEYYQEELDDIDNVLTDPCFHPVEIMSDFFENESFYDPILEYYTVPVEVIRMHFLNGDYKVKGLGEICPNVWFVYKTNNQSKSWELVTSG